MEIIVKFVTTCKSYHDAICMINNISSTDGRILYTEIKKEHKDIHTENRIKVAERV